jgi:hypothetical protein
VTDYSVLAGSLGTPRPKPPCEPIPRADRDAPWTTEAHYRTAREIVRDRSAGVCEFDGCTAPASNVHHRAGRGFPATMGPPKRVFPALRQQPGNRPTPDRRG